ncbi:DUF4936 family protein [Massilia sp. TS11]|uniref:DUF4936 family protein n=1 Tax=Massilia sp. TS11 TaxID=2908003 RepID=UPI001EDB26FC|nr:DUF4936 family protein [Massilia sp. TS11]MCG2584705.1 DUF4936 family protein [Massilia sp. TS11]
MPDLYIYYRVPDAHAAALLPKVQAMQASLGVPSRLKRRPESKDGLQTWMEVYENVDAGFAARLDAAVSAAGLAAEISGTRHVETFIPCAPCA